MQWVEVNLMSHKDMIRNFRRSGTDIWNRINIIVPNFVINHKYN